MFRELTAAAHSFALWAPLNGSLFNGEVTLTENPRVQILDTTEWALGDELQ